MPTDIRATSVSELNYWMGKFVMEVRKKSPAGEDYPPNTLYILCCGVQRFLREDYRREIDIFTDADFKLFRDSLDAEMKRLTKLGVWVW